MAKKVVKEVSNEKVDYPLIAYILGILSIVQAFFSPLSGVVFSIIGLVLAKKEKTSLSKKAKKLSIIGLILSIIFIVISIIYSIINYLPLMGAI